MEKLHAMGLVNDYTITWCIYLLACIGIFIVVWRCSRRWPTLPRQALRFIVACVVLVPTAVETGQDSLAPAFIVAIFEGATGDTEGAATALSALALTIVLGLLFYGVWLAGKHFYLKKRAAKPVTRTPRQSDEAPTTAA